MLCYVLGPNSALFRLGPQAQTKDCSPDDSCGGDGRGLAVGAAIIVYSGMAPQDPRFHPTIQGSELKTQVPSKDTHLLCVLCSSQTERDQKTRAIGILLWKPCVSCWWPKSLTTQMLPFYNHGTFLLQSGGWFCPSIFFRFFQCTSVMKTIYCCFQWETTMFQVFRTRWWMGAYGSTTPKRHVGYSNAKSIGLLNLGTLKWDYSSAKYQQNKTTKRSTKGQKKQFTGVNKTLKASQKLGCAVEPKTLLSNFFFKFWDGFR